MTRRRLLALAFGATPILGVAVACSFPDVSYSPVVSNRPDTGADTSVDTAVIDASSDRTDSGIGNPEAGAVDAAGCNNSCDCDGDHYWRDAGCDAAATDASGRLGFGDCDDFDSKYSPGQTQFFEVATGSNGFDYNCDHVATGKFTGNLSCTGVSLTGCSPASGDFNAAPPACGQSGGFSTCVGNGLGCSASVPGNAIQPCH